MSDYEIDFQLEDDVLPAPYENIQFDDSETQDVGGLFVHQSTECVHSEANRGCKRKGRGKTIVKWGVGGVRERVKWGKSGVPLWPRDKCAHYSNYLGILASDCGYFAIDVKDWRHFDEGNLGPAWTLIEQHIEKAEEERRRLNVDITPAVKEDIYAEVFGPEKRNQVRGLGAGVQWRDAPNIHIEKRSVSCVVEGLKAKLEEQRLETERLKSEAEKERQAAAQREETRKNEASEMAKNLSAQMEEFKKQQETMMASKVKELALFEMGRWMKEAGFSQIQTAPQIEPMTQLPQCMPTPEIND